MNTIAISDLRAMLPRVVSEVNNKLKRVIVTVSGKPKAAVISLDELESLEETAEVLSLPGALKAIEKSKKDFDSGRYINLEKLKQKRQV